jgi:predicted enzyme related to lactoylglutathione lyase
MSITNLGDFEGMITFTYYDDLEGAVDFYSDLFGFELVIDLEHAKVFKVAENTHFGLVSGQKGYLKTSEDKPVMLTFIVEDIEAWNKHLKRKGIKIEQPPKEADYLKMKTLLIRDPEGYVVEILEFLKKPYGHP